MVIHYGENDAYDEPSCCPVCDSSNEYVKEWFQDCWGSPTLVECKTKCTKCGHQNHWAHGHFTERWFSKI